MASKENQMSLDIIAKALPFETYICYIHTLQKAINDLELYKKAVEILIKQSMCNYTYDAWEKRILQLARKELENGK